MKAGYFVWNREKDRYREGRFPKKNEVPLYWAHNIKPNCVVEPFVDEPTLQKPVGFVRLEKGSRVAITSDAVLLQRTSNRRQKRRLIAGLVLQRNVLGGAGFLSENHTIQWFPNQESCRLFLCGRFAACSIAQQSTAVFAESAELSVSRWRRCELYLYLPPCGLWKPLPRLLVATTRQRRRHTGL